VQKVDGTKGTGTVGSELAAVMDLAMLPDMLKRHQLFEHPCGPRDSLDVQSKRMAALIGRPADWHLIMYPFWLSLDNCKKHPWIRKLLCAPRLSAAEAEALEAEISEMMHNIISRYVREHWATVYQQKYGDVRDVMVAFLAGNPPDSSWWQWQFWQRTGAQGKEHQLTMRQACMRYLAHSRPWLRVVLPEQFMPLAPCTPELHAIEHMCGTVKRYVDRAALQEEDDDARQYARTWQAYAEEAIEKKGNGEAGVKHHSGSARKLPLIASVLAAEKDSVVVLPRTRSGSNSVQVRVVMGTGGACIPTGSMGWIH